MRSVQQWPDPDLPGFMGNTGGDWVNFDVMTAGAGNDVPALELYPSDMFSGGAWSCTGTGVAATGTA